MGETGLRQPPAPRVGFVSLGCVKDSQYKPLQEHMKGLAYVVSNARQLNRE